MKSGEVDRKGWKIMWLVLVLREVSGCYTVTMLKALRCENL